MKYSIVILLLGFSLLTACVPKDQYNAAVTELNYYRSQAERADSLEAQTAMSTYNNAGNDNMELQKRIQQVESLTATNISLNRSFQDMKERYDEQLNQNKLLLEQNGSEVTNLQQSLAERAQLVSQQEQELRQKEIELQAREGQLAQLDPNGSTATPGVYGSVAAPTPFGQQPQGLGSTQNAALQQNQLQSQLAQNLIGYPRNEVVVMARDADQVVVTLSQGQLFADGFFLSQGGRGLLQRIATILQAYPGSSIQVVGHNDAGAEAVAAFENSTDRAIAVTQNLISHGIAAQQLMVASKGYYSPVAGNNTAAERAANRRTEIVITLN